MKKAFWALFTVYLTVQVLLQPTRGENSTDTTFECPSSQFTCKNQRCIPSRWKCDGDDDCNDGDVVNHKPSSDEDDCAVTCSSEDQFTCDNGQCISSRWQCDRETDCRDGSDEKPELCAKKTCKEDQFACNNGACIPKTWMCDGQKDCVDNAEDEDDAHCEKVTCKEGEFTCDNGRCISERWMCDQDNDCTDNSDESPENCPAESCDADEFECANKLCVKKSWVCDGDIDCKDESDEANCSSTDIHPKCSPTEFVCNITKECVHMSWRCDGDSDCSDDSDEKDCVITCRPDQFKCVQDSYCISDVLHCDGNRDCKDGSDEEGCEAKCKNDEFDCHGDGQKCIKMTKVCDSMNDCGNFEDEDPERFNCDAEAINPCDNNNGHCNQICVNKHQGDYICDCRQGFQLDVNSTTECVDIDECLTPGTCSQICTNTKGGYKCSCEAGYFLSDRKSCRVDGKGPQLLLANRKDLRRIDIANEKKIDYSLVVNDDNVECAIAVDYDIRNNKVYWTDVKIQKIMSADMNDPTKITTVADEFVNTPDGIAYDWIHQHLYWTDTGYEKIEVASLDGKMRRVLIDSDLDEPRGIVLDPSNGYMYWTDWGQNPKIEKCGMDGSDRRVIVDRKKLPIEWPNGITIDYVDMKLFWLDAKLHHIVSSDYEGNNWHIVHSSHVNVPHPFGIAVFEDSIYYTDWRSESVWKMNKFGIGQPSKVALDLNEPTDVHILHEYKQKTSEPTWSNRCGDNHGCEHFCLPSPMSKRYSCVCQNFFELAHDGKHCIEIANKSSIPEPKVDQKPDSPNKSKHPRAWGAVINKSTGKTKANVETTTKTHVHIPHEATTDSGYDIITSTDNSTQKSAPFKKEEVEDIGKIAGIVVAVILGIGILVGLVLFVLFRRLRRKNMKSMNFDNPVYRKTTEDQFAIDKANKLPPSMQPLNPPTNEIV